MRISQTKNSQVAATQPDHHPNFAWKGSQHRQQNCDEQAGSLLPIRQWRMFSQPCFKLLIPSRLQTFHQGLYGFLDKLASVRHLHHGFDCHLRHPSRFAASCISSGVGHSRSVSVRPFILKAPPPEHLRRHPLAAGHREPPSGCGRIDRTHLENLAYLIAHSAIQDMAR